MWNHAAGFYAEPCRGQKTCARRQEKQGLDSAQWRAFSFSQKEKGKLSLAQNLLLN